MTFQYRKKTKSTMTSEPEGRHESVKGMSDDKEALDALGGGGCVLAVTGERRDDGLGAVHGVHADSVDLTPPGLRRIKENEEK